MNQQTNSYTFHVHGMHCNSCVVLTESVLGEHEQVVRVKANLKKLSVEVQGNFGNKSGEEVAKTLSPLLEKHGYKLSLEKEVNKVRWSDFRVALPIAFAFVAIFIVLQKLGIVNLISSGEATYGTAFVVGLIASVSTCMAVVGGLVLSVSAKFAQDGDKIKPQMYFHIGRIISFFILGGVIGAIGSNFQFKGTGTFVLSLLVGAVMLVLGINLLDVFGWAKKLQPTLPKSLSHRLLKVKKLNHTLMPLLLGVVTFILPCGFTQSMQLYALSTGSVLTGAMTMLVFALGTLPVLALLSFASLGIHNNLKSGIFYKSAGLVVIFFALFNIINALVAAGWISPVFNF